MAPRSYVDLRLHGGVRRVMQQSVCLEAHAETHAPDASGEARSHRNR